MEILGVAWENILVGLLSGVIIGLIAYLKNSVTDYRIERKFPIKGNYISKFEDEINGNKLLITAPAILKQKGKKVFGETSMPDDKRKWILDGEISSGGHIHGVYYAEDPYDKGIGNFFLFINYKKQMEGLWSGFDSINQKISSGRYTFVPCLDDLIIRNATNKDLSRILEISDAELGKDYLDESVKNKIISDNAIFRVALSAKDGLLGFCYSYITEAEALVVELGIKKLPKHLKISSKISVLKTIAVRSDMKGRGIGSSLMKDSIELFKKQNIESIFSLAWKSKKGINIEGLMNQYEFKQYQEIENFWSDDSKEKGYLCPECGNPCKCSAIIYTKAI